MKKSIRLGMIFLVAMAMSACAGGKAMKQTGTMVPGVQAVKGEPAKAYSGKEYQAATEASLFRESSYYGFFQDLRAHKVGDLVTINIVETSKATKKADTKTARTSSIDAGISNLLGYETKMGSWGVPHAFDNTAMFKASMGNKFDGSGSTSRDESMTASITAKVVQVLPNGNLFIEGTRKIRVNNETQNITLSGIIRPSDISPDNTVLSSYIADAKIDYTGSGPVSDKQRPGWLARILDVVWPF
ncbi:MAG: flagellar basal body L-ring protein FlgH [Deltaproteobacteria bacterium]|nr:flagellar basal body L-ring protein FlgH [Deltaproteobacteria bacterium]